MEDGFSIDVSTLGKGKMVTQVAAVVGLILGLKYGGWVQGTAKILLWAVVFFALLSMIQYFREFWSKLDSNIVTAQMKIPSGAVPAESVELGRLRNRARKQQRSWSTYE
jgi:hypothetical protein